MPLALPFKINVPKTETTVNLKSASFVVIMLLHESLTHIQSQIKPWLLFGESFALRMGQMMTCNVEGRSHSQPTDNYFSVVPLGSMEHIF